MNKRGNITDALVIIMIVFFLAFGLFLSVYFIKKLDTSLISAVNGSNPAAITKTSLAMVNNVDNQLPWTIDWFIIMMMFGLPLLSMALAFFNNIHPMFFWMSFGFTMLVVVVGTWFAIAWQNLLASGDIGANVSNLPLTSWVMNNYVIYAIFVVFLICLGTWVKTKNANQGYNG